MAAIGRIQTFRFRSVEVRGASGRADPGSRAESERLKPVSCHVNTSSAVPYTYYGMYRYLYAVLALVRATNRCGVTCTGIIGFRRRCLDHTYIVLPIDRIYEQHGCQRAISVEQTGPASWNDV